MYKAYEIKPDIYWVGDQEYNERYIHGISMPWGSSNNAYLIMDEKITLIDTCHIDHASQLIERISDVVDPSEISYIISNHSEKDHAGALAKVIEVAPNAEVITSNPKGAQILNTYLGPNAPLHPVANGEELNIGKRTLKFVHTMMVHWPDNMVTYCPEDKILFSNDAFGQFICTSKRFDDEVHLDNVFACAKKYFANIISPYTMQTKKAVEIVKTLDLDMIAPSHGIIWRSHIDKIFKLYDKMCDHQPDDQAVVIYTSMYGTTERMAKTIYEAFMHKGINVRLYDLDVSDLSEVLTDVYFSKYVAIGSPTHNMTVLPPAGEFLTYFKGLAPKGDRIGISFGSYGWAPSAQKEIADAFDKVKYEMPVEMFTADWNDTPERDAELFEAVEKLIDSQEQ